MGALFIRQQWVKKFVAFALSIVFALGTVVPSYALNDFLRPQALRQSNRLEDLENNLSDQKDGGVITKKAPGTDAVTNIENQFHLRLSEDMSDPDVEQAVIDHLVGWYGMTETQAKDAFYVTLIPEPVKEYLLKELGVSKEVLKAMQDKEHEPATFRERVSYFLSTDKIKFKVDYLDDKVLIADIARRFNKYDASLDSSNMKITAFYPRLNEGLGILGFLEVKENVTDKKGVGFIHISKDMWKEMWEKDRNIHALAQLIMHETSEYIMGSPRGISSHQFGVLQEMYYLSPDAQTRGISDLDFYILQNAVKSNDMDYINNLLRQYSIDRDPTLGSFYTVLWNLLNKNGVIPAVARKPLPSLDKLLGARFIKKASGTPEFDPMEIDALDKYSKGTPQGISGDVVKMIVQNRIGSIYEPLLKLINSKRLTLVTDDLNGQELYVPDASKRDIGAMFFIKETETGSDKNYEIHLTRALWEKKHADANFMASLLVFVYIQHFVPEVHGLSRHRWAGLHALRFGTDDAKMMEVNDLDLFYLDYAKNNNKVAYLYDLLNQYWMAMDPQGTYKMAIYAALGEMDPNALTSALNLDSGERLLSYYGYLFEYYYREVPISERVEKISDDLRSLSKSNANFAVLFAALLNGPGKKYFYQYNYYEEIKNKDGVVIRRIPKEVYLPENVSILLDMNSVGQMYLTADEKIQIARMKREIKKRQGPRRIERNKGIFKDLSLIKKLNSEIDSRLKTIAPIWDKQFIKQMNAEIERRVTEASNDGVFVVGYYGPTSTGKTTLTDLAMAHLAGLGLNVNFVSSDSYLYPGDNFRYNKLGAVRFTNIKGQSIYNVKALARDLADLKAGRTIFTPWDSHAPGYDNSLKGKTREVNGKTLDVLVIDFTSFGIDETILKQVDMLVPIIFKSDLTRAARRDERDTRSKEEGGERGDSIEQVLGDTAEKAFQELFQQMKYIIMKAQARDPNMVMWMQDTNELWQLKGADRYKIDKLIKENKEVIRLSDMKSSSSIEVVPSLGATVISFTVDGKELLYFPVITKSGVSVPDFSTSGGIPVLWPYANRIRGSRFDFNGQAINLKGVNGTKDDGKGNVYHGLVRGAVPWHVESQGFDARGAYIRLAIGSDEVPEIGEHFGKMRLEVTYRLQGTRLSIESQIFNQDNKEVITSLAFHPWFNTPQQGQWQVKIPAQKYWRAQDQIPTGDLESVVGTKYDFQTQTGLLSKTYDDVLTGLSYSDGKAVSELFDPLNNTLIKVSQDQGYKDVVFYVPSDKEVVCIEPQSSATDAFNLRNKNIEEAAPIVLAPGQKYRGSIEIEAFAGGVSELASAYERMDRSLVHEMTLDSVVDGQTYRMNISVPRQMTRTIDDYIRARLFNLFVITGPQQVTIYAPVALQTVLQQTVDNLFNSPQGYTPILERIAAVYEKNKKTAIVVKDVSAKPVLPVNQQQIVGDLQQFLAKIKQITGVAVGIDIGGTDVKLFILDEKNNQWTKKYSWDEKPKNFSSLDQFKVYTTKLATFMLAVYAYKTQTVVSDGALAARIDAALEKSDVKMAELEAIIAAIKAAGVTLVKPSSIGISFPDIIVNNEIVGGITSKTGTVRKKYGKDLNGYWNEFNREVRPLADLVSAELVKVFDGPAIPVAITNDGNVGSIWAATVLLKGNICNFAGGTSFGGGFIGADGQLKNRIFEMGYLVTNVGTDKNIHETWKDISGTAQKLFSQHTVMEAGQSMGILAADLKEMQGDILKYFQLTYAGKDVPELPELRNKLDGVLLRQPTQPEIKAIFEQVGTNLALIVSTVEGAMAAESLRGTTVVLFGRLIESETGRLVINTAKEELNTKFGISNIELQRASDVAEAAGYSKKEAANMDALAQSLGAIYLGNLKRLTMEGALAEAPAMATTAKQADAALFNAFSKGFGEVVKAAEEIKGQDAALIIGAHTVLENGGVVSALKMLKEASSSLKVAVWAAKYEDIKKLQALGISSIADVVTARGLESALSDMQSMSVDRSRMVVVNAQEDLHQVRMEIEQLLQQYKGVRAINLKTPYKEVKGVKMNIMPLVIGKAVATVLNDQEAVVNAYMELVSQYGGQISESDMQALTDLTKDLSDMPLILITDKVSEDQIAYQETSDKV